MTYNIQEELREIERDCDVLVVATKIKKILKLVKVSAAHSFEKLFENLNDFNYKIEDISKTKIEQELKPLEIQSIIEKRKTMNFSYRMTCDNGDADKKSGALYYRQGRKMFIENMIDYIEKLTVKNKLSINMMEYKEASGGGDPRLEIRMTHNYSRGVGERKEEKTITIKFTFYLKYLGKKSNESPSKKIKKMTPKNIGIAGKRVTALAIKNAVKTYLGENNFMWSHIVSNAFEELDKTLSTTFVEIISLGSEGIEIFSAYALLKRLSFSPSLRREIGIDEIYKKSAKWTVFFPLSSNFPMVDYFLVPPNVRIIDENTSLKVSIKNAVKTDPNVVKPKDLFSNVSEVTNWKKNKGQTNVGQFYTMLGAVAKKSRQPKETSPLYPLYSVSIMKDVELREIIEYSLKYFNYPTTTQVKDVILQFIKNCDKSKIKRTLDKEGDILTILKNKNYSTKKIENIIINTIAKTSKKSAGNDYKITIGDLSLFFEKGLVNASKKNEMLNFKEVFYDRAIVKEQVIFITSKLNVNKTRKITKVYFEIMAKANWSKLKGDWMSLRSKNNFGNLQDSLGIDPRRK